MVSGTLKIHQNQWRVVQNQGSLKNVKMASEVASRVNFGAILKHLWLPKCIFHKKRGSWKSVPQKVPSKSQTSPGTDSGQAGWLPESPPLASKSCLDNSQETTTIQQKYQQLQKCCFNRLFLFWFLVGFRFQCRLSPWSCWRSEKSCWKKKQCWWSDTPWAKARRIYPYMLVQSAWLFRSWI